MKRRSLCDNCCNQDHCLIMVKYETCAEYDPIYDGEADE